MGKKSLLGILSKNMGLLTPDKVIEIKMIEDKFPDRKIDNIIMEVTTLTETDLIRAKEILYKIPGVNLDEISFDSRLISLVPEKLARHYLFLPIEEKEDGLHIAIADPENIIALDEIQIVTGKTIIPHLAMPSQLNEFIEKLYRLDYDTTHQMIQQLEEEVIGTEEEDDLYKDEANEAPIIGLVNRIIGQALQNRASDIHIEPTRGESRVRYRTDGVLSTQHRLPRKVHPPLISRLKIISDLDIAQRFIPQDGSITYTYRQKKIDLRISIVPTIFGEKVVLRILNSNSQRLTLKELGLRGKDLKLYKKILNKSHGILLVTGPTGSGKSTTLSSSIEHLLSSTINISTVEDPVEYKIPGINQLQVNTKTGLTFAKALRALLRQDPDILMIGEIRDEETANIAIRAALTGHLVLSSLHTNDAVSTIMRLKNMDIQPHLLASTLIGVVAQRLVRKICPTCRQKTEISHEERIFFNLQGVEEPHTVYVGKGCSKCNFTGYYGRVGIFEILNIDRDISQKIGEKFSSQLLYNIQKQKNSSLIKDSLLKVEKGITTMAEVLRVIV